MKVAKPSQSKIVGIAAMLVGACWVGLQLRLFILVDIHRTLDVGGVAPLLTILLPAVLAIFYGAKVCKTASKVNITRSIGFSLCCVALFLPGFSTGMMQSNPYDEALFQAGLLFSDLLMALLLYVLLCKVTMKSENIEYSGPHELFSEPFAVVISILFAVFIVAPVLWRFMLLDFVDPLAALGVLTLGTVFVGWIFYLSFITIVGTPPESAKDSAPKHA